MRSTVLRTKNTIKAEMLAMALIPCHKGTTIMQPTGGNPMRHDRSGQYDQRFYDPVHGNPLAGQPPGLAQNHQYYNNQSSTQSSLYGAAGSSEPRPSYGSIGYPQYDRRDQNGYGGHGQPDQSHGSNAMVPASQGYGEGSGLNPPSSAPQSTPEEEEDDEGTTVDAAVWFTQGGNDKVPFTKGEILKAYSRMIKDIPGVKPATGAGQSGQFGAYQIYTDTESAKAFVKDADGEALVITSDNGKQGQLKVSVRLDNPDGKNYSNKNQSSQSLPFTVTSNSILDFNSATSRATTSLKDGGPWVSPRFEARVAELKWAKP